MTHPGQLHPAQRFDRDAVKAMLVDALKSANLDQDQTYATLGTVQGDPVILIDRLRAERHYFDADLLADTVMEWFGGKGAA